MKKKNSVIEFPAAAFLDVSEILRITSSKGYQPIFLSSFS